MRLPRPVPEHNRCSPVLLSVMYYGNRPDRAHSTEEYVKPGNVRCQLVGNEVCQDLFQSIINVPCHLISCYQWPPFLPRKKPVLGLDIIFFDICRFLFFKCFFRTGLYLKFYFIFSIIISFKDIKFIFLKSKSRSRTSGS